MSPPWPFPGRPSVVGRCPCLVQGPQLDEGLQRTRQRPPGVAQGHRRCPRQETPAAWRSSGSSAGIGRPRRAPTGSVKRSLLRTGRGIAVATQGLREGGAWSGTGRRPAAAPHTWLQHGRHVAEACPLKTSRVRAAKSSCAFQEESGRWVWNVADHREAHCALIP